MAVSAVVLGDDRATGDVEGGEQAGGAVADAVMGARAAARGQDRQDGHVGRSG